MTEYLQDATENLHALNRFGSQEADTVTRPERNIYSDDDILDLIAHQNILLLGIPGAGKTTLAQALRSGYHY